MHIKNKNITISLYIYLLIPTLLILMSLGGIYYQFIGGSIFILLAILQSLPVAVREISRLKVNKADILSLLFLLLLFICYFRGIINNTIEWYKAFFLCIIWITIFFAYKKIKNNLNYFDIIWLGIIFYVVINFILFVAGISPPANAYSDAGEAKIFSNFVGFAVKRTQFPVSLGVNGFGVICGLSTLLSVVRLIISRSFYSIVLFLICISSLLLSDSRGAIAGFIVSILLLFIFYLFRTNLISRIITSVIFLLYPLASYLIYSLSILLIGKFSNLSRGNSILSGRDVIWEGIIDFLKSMPIYNIIFGYGYMGQVTSGLSLSYMNLFAHLDNLKEETVNLHSSFFQLFIDMGLIGIAFLLFFIFKLLNLNAKKFIDGDNTALYGLCFVSYGVIVGATDLTFNQNNLVFTLCILAISININFLSNKKT